MRQALIDPETPAMHVVGYAPGTTPPQPLVAAIPNSARVAQVVADGNTFPVADPLFWTACADNIVADQWYYDTVQGTIFVVQNNAAADQPAVEGAQTL